MDKEINKEESSGVSYKNNSLLDYIYIILKWKKLILIFTSVILVISIILYFFVFDLIYFSTATIKSSAKSSSLLSSLGEGISDFGMEDLGVLGGKSAKELSGFEEILKSRRCLEEVVNKFELMKMNEYLYMEDAVRDFRDDKMVLSQDKFSGVLYVGVYDKDRELAKEMVDFLISELDKINIELNVQNAKNNREFIEKRFFNAKEELKQSEDSLKSFQLIYGVSPDLQIKAAAQTAFTLEADIKTEEVKLDVLRKLLAPDQLEVRTQEFKIEALKNQLSNIQNSTDLNDLLRLGNSPNIAMSYLILQRDVEIQTKIVTFLLPIYEQAKIEEKRETPTLLILDKPYVAERKSKPKRLTMTIVWTMFAFFGASFGVIFLEKIKSITQQSKINNKNKTQLT